MNSENIDANVVAAKLTVDEIRNSLRKKAATSTSDVGADIEAVKPSKKKTLAPPAGGTSTTPPRGTSGGPPVAKEEGVKNPRDEETSSTRKPRSGRHGHSVESEEPSLVKEKYSDLACLSEEILTYCHLLDNSRDHTIRESVRLRETVRELEKLLDSARLREKNHLGDVEQHREAIAMFEKRYFNLKSRAKTHIKESQDDREKLKSELEATQTKLKTAESELYAAQSLVHSQLTEVERLKEQTKNMPSEKELTNMSLKLRRLEDENGKLATERAKLMAQLDDLQTSKREDGTGPKWSRKEHELESTIDRLKDELKKAKAENEQLKTDVRKYEQYCEVLLAAVEKGKEDEDV